MKPLTNTFHKKGCETKIKYRSDNAASKALHKQQGFGIPVQRVYRCPDCGHLHLTSSSRPDSSRDLGGRVNSTIINRKKMLLRLMAEKHSAKQMKEGWVL